MICRSIVSSIVSPIITPITSIAREYESTDIDKICWSVDAYHAAIDFEIPMGEKSIINVFNAADNYYIAINYEIPMRESHISNIYDAAETYYRVINYQIPRGMLCPY